MANKNYALFETVKVETIKEMLDLAVKEVGKNIAFEYKKGE